MIHHEIKDLICIQKCDQSGKHTKICEFIFMNATGFLLPLTYLLAVVGERLFLLLQFGHQLFLMHQFLLQGLDLGVFGHFVLLALVEPWTKKDNFQSVSNCEETF